LEYEVVKKTPEAFEVNVTECRYAKFDANNHARRQSL